jgi:hypothetical protein
MHSCGITTFSPKPTKINYPSNGKDDLTELGKRQPHSRGWKISIKCKHRLKATVLMKSASVITAFQIIIRDAN